MRASNTAPLTLNHPYRDRWSNPFTIDSSRVHLLPPSEPCPSPGGTFDDYIAANFIVEDPSTLPELAPQLTFIASQAPIPETFEHFWSMVWDQGTDMIFMLTKLEENGRVKAHAYWPSCGSDQVTAGPFSVALADANVCPSSGAEYRRLLLTRAIPESPPESRSVQFYQYMEWPDHSVPSDDRASEIAHLIQTVIDRLQPGHTLPPPIIHCSAGAGRTGVFIATALEYHRLLNLAPPEDPAALPLRVFQTVAHMRTQRRHMVQELSQYKFIFTLLQHLLHTSRPEWFLTNTPPDSSP
ncbi:MAG: protein-tyrosine phosphatase family protein [archaeon]|nr:protein-tyrosine phosphatase family protein [archaeon]